MMYPNPMAHPPQHHRGRWAFLAILVLITAGLAVGVARSDAASSITDRLTTNQASIEVTSLPPGSTAIHVAYMQNLQGAGVKYVNLPASQRIYTPPAGDPVVDVQGWGSRGALGSWAGRLQTVPGDVPVEEPPAEPPLEEPPHEEQPSSPLVVGVDTGGWQGSLFTELLAGGINWYRVHQSAAAAAPAGHIASIAFGEGGAIGSINPGSYAAEVAAAAGRYHPLTVEVLNEPDNPGFWSDAGDTTAYARLTKAVHEALAGVSPRPAELCSWDGGEGPNSSWGQSAKAAGAYAWCDGVTAHAYGGKTGSDGGALGGRRDVEQAHAGSGLPVYVTEIGWPTCVGCSPTGDSQQWSEAQQASNITGFIGYARGLRYVPMVVIFNAVDYGTNDFYGIETSSRKHKQSFAALAAAAR